MDELTIDEIADLLHHGGPDHYRQQVIRLFASGRATQAQWAAMAQAVLHVSESGEAAIVSCIDRAVLAALRVREGGR